jgi:hypothetical protein
MNERIRQLEDQASQYASRETTDLDEWEFIFRKKFAELIVAECAKVAWYHTPDTEELEYSHLIEDKILEHFGVK